MTNRDYLAVDDFLRTEVDAKVLQFALRSGLIDRLLIGSVSFEEIPVRTIAGRRLLVDLLIGNGVAGLESNHVKLTPTFRTVLAFRDLMEAKLAIGEEVSRDITNHFGSLFEDLPSFMERSATFALFRYDRCFDATKSNIETTERWMRFTTSLTRYEGRVLAETIDLQGINRLLDIGGNSGELALQLCAVNPRLAATVFDLPVVCGIGRRHVDARGPEEVARRIAFTAGDMRRDSLPGDMDALTLKSVLHDWPETDAALFISRAARCLRPGGLFIIFERGPLRPTAGIPYGQLSNLVFFPFFREPDLYLGALQEAGLHIESVEQIALDMAFTLIVARRPIGS